jgi:UDP-2,3-diacylglucosamine pyrophosphatase LpxH
MAMCSTIQQKAVQNFGQSWEAMVTLYCLDSIVSSISFYDFFGHEKVSLSKKVMQKVNESIIKIDEFETLVAELAIEKKYDYVICGHIHQPQKRVITNKQGSVTYLNSGDG